MPRTYGENDIEKKKDLKNRILSKLDDPQKYRDRCKGKLLALEIVFYLSRMREAGSPKDLDNMLKILCDTLPDYVDRAETQIGLGFIAGKSDHTIYSIGCAKRLVEAEVDEGLDIEIYEWIEDSKILKAASFAKEKHKNQLRKDGKTEYWHHLEQVVSNVKQLGIKDDDLFCACWLHDTIEDTNTDFDDIEEEFGLGVAQIVAATTKDKRLPEDKRENDYVAQLQAASWKALVVKLCDIWANVADMPSGYKEQQKQVEQVEKKLRYFEAIRKGLYDNKDKIPNLDKGVDELNALLSPYGKAVKL